jgi:hypothetical protein
LSSSVNLPPDPLGAARRIAAMANAARGEHFLWLVGVDQNTGSTFQVNTDVASWWPAVQACFEGDPPVMRVTHAEELLVLAFDPEAPPYVVKTRPQEGEKAHLVHPLVFYLSRTSGRA